MLVISGHRFRVYSEYVNDGYVIGIAYVRFFTVFSLHDKLSHDTFTYSYPVIFLWQVLVNGLLPWHLLNSRGIRKLPGVYDLISLHGFSVAAQVPGGEPL